ncbi:chromate efflux transporter [Roseibium sp. CAU 1637]|uniref:Chromate efflux transporter n=1 Tax=Roseibium limicola TaxID=2816037 RepID=A0A939J8A9_9HYPH|nr:chromate efflux transporter [Roseibium limicola]MBO0347017.1 chromate efflux transporter [Roseibium limicola]
MVKDVTDNDETKRNATPSDEGNLASLATAGLKIGVLSFGGPAVQIALMHDEFVTRRKWLSADRFQHALSFCMLLPGPEAQQLATYCGWLMAGVRGGLITGLLFILPGALIMAALSTIYVLYGAVPLVEAIFYGLKGGVLAIVLQALWRITQKALAGAFLKALCLAAFIALFAFNLPFPLVVLAAGLLGFLFAPNPTGVPEAPATPERLPVSKQVSLSPLLLKGLVLWAAPAALAALLIAPDHVLVRLSGFFSTLAVVSFGGAYALLSYMAQVVVDTLGWLSPEEMLDGLALAETTPGPLILVTQFVGFLAGWRFADPFAPLTGALLAAAVTTWVTFAPSFLFVLIGAPFMERLRGIPALRRALAGISAAVAGTILNLSVWFALNTLFAQTRQIQHGPLDITWPTLTTLDPVLAGITLLALGLTLGARLSIFPLLGICCAAGLLARYAL